MPDVDAARVLVIGVGNEYRRDDGVGPYVARRLAEQSPPGVGVGFASGEGASLMEQWAGFDRVILVDATACGQSPGTVRRFDAQAGPLPTQTFHYSTHAFSLSEAVELARVLGRLPSKLTVVGIEGRSFGAGPGLSKEVHAAADQLIQGIRAELT